MKKIKKSAKITFMCNLYSTKKRKSLNYQSTRLLVFSFTVYYYYCVCYVTKICDKKGNK